MVHRSHLQNAAGNASSRDEVAGWERSKGQRATPTAKATTQQRAVKWFPSIKAPRPNTDHVYRGNVCIHTFAIPLWIKSKCWCQRFYNDKSRDIDPFLETALYRIASTKLLFKMAISIKLLAPSHSLNVLFWPGGGSWPSIISQTPTLIHCHLAWMLQLLLPSWCQAPSNL